jgi:hypothetical protein
MTGNAPQQGQAITSPSVPLDDHDIRKFNDYLVKFVEEATGYRLRRSHLGPVFADRVSPVTSDEAIAGVMSTLQGLGEPKALVEEINRQNQAAIGVAWSQKTVRH